jgi:hypothetical protein
MEMKGNQRVTVAQTFASTLGVVDRNSEPGRPVAMERSERIALFATGGGDAEPVEG